MRLLALVAAGVSSISLSATELKTWPLPEGVARFPLYTLRANGKEIDVLEAPRPQGRVIESESYAYGYARLEADGPVEFEVSITADDFSVGDAKIVPARLGCAVEKVDEKTMRFTLVPPCTVCCEPAGRHRSLVIALFAPEKDAPDPGDPGTVYIGPGLHRRALTELKSGQTLYLDGGAILEGALVAEGDGIEIRGRGILSGAPWPWLNGPVAKTPEWGGDKPAGTLTSISGNGITVRDATFFSPWCWTLVLNSATNCLVDNVKIIGGRVINDDGIDICRTKDVEIRNSFIRCQDDCIAPKWSCENLVVTNCVLWSDIANNIRIGYECDRPPARVANLLFKDLDLPHMTMERSPDSWYWASGAIEIQASNGQRFENIVFDGLRIGEMNDYNHFMFVKTMPISESYDYPEPGTIDGVTLRNVSLPPGEGARIVRLEAADDGHPVRNVVFENVVNLGEIELSGKVENFRRSGVRVIFDTDMITDFDDMGALAILHALADRGECEILATLSSTRSNSSVAAIEICNAYYGRGNLPVGAPKAEYAAGGAPFGHDKYIRLAAEYPQWVRHENADSAPDAVRVYREVLSRQEDKSVVVCSVGFLTNLRGLLESQPDDISPLGGRELVARKVSHWVAMGGFYPWGHEYNFDGDGKSSMIVLRDWPTPAFFTDGQYGKDVYTGRALAESVSKTRNPVRDVYAWTLMPRSEISPSSWDQTAGHSSWDLTAVLMAVRGVESYFTLERGYYEVMSEDGYDEWRYDPGCDGGRILEKTPRTEVAALIDDLLMAPPKSGPHASPKTFCNPMPLVDYPVGLLARSVANGGESDHHMWYTDETRQFRETADPSLLYENGVWYVFPSCDACWKSYDGGASWTHVPLGLSGAEGARDRLSYAPTAVKHRGEFLLMGSLGDVFKAKRPDGPYEYLGHLNTPEGIVDGEQITWLWDPMLFSDDDGRLYLYWGSSATNGIWGCELDAKNPVRYIDGTARHLVRFEPETQPWEISPGSNPPVSYIEGPWMVKNNGDYILTYSAAGTEYKEYAMGQAIGKSPLGPFVKSAINPFLKTERGTVTGTAHGSIVKGPGGYWAAYSIVGGSTHRFERFIGFDRVYIDCEGRFAFAEASDTPQWLPPHSNGATGWKKLPGTVVAGAEAAVDGALSTYWTVPDLPSVLQIDFGAGRTVRAYRLVWHDVGLDEMRGVVKGPYRYRVEYLEDGEWRVLADASQNDTDLFVDYRETPAVKTSSLRLCVLGGPAGITPAVKEFTPFGD